MYVHLYVIQQIALALHPFVPDGRKHALQRRLLPRIGYIESGTWLVDRYRCFVIISQLDNGDDFNKIDVLTSHKQRGVMSSEQ